MSSTIVPYRNGPTPYTRNGHAPAGRVVPLLGPTVDHLAKLRALLRQAQQAERELNRRDSRGLRR